MSADGSRVMSADSSKVVSVDGSKVVSAEPLDTQDAKWIRLVKLHYKDPNGQTRTWETAERRTRPAGGDLDGVGIFAVLEKPGGPELVLQKQYRPPIDRVTIEVPAGLVDAGETAEQAAVRELREETGYVGVATGAATPVLFHDPGFCNTNLRMVHVAVDLADPSNRHPQPRLEDGEFIDVFTVPLRGLYAACQDLEAAGFAIDARVGTIAEGIEVAKKYGLSA